MTGYKFKPVRLLVDEVVQVPRSYLDYNWFGSLRDGLPGLRIRRAGTVVWLQEERAAEYVNEGKAAYVEGVG